MSDSKTRNEMDSPALEQIKTEGITWVILSISELTG
jgi:hypothetical protein